MNTRTALACILGMSAWTAASCDDRAAHRDADTNTTDTSTVDTTPETPPTPPDNTANNLRDMDTNTATPLDQSEDPEDIRITGEIRRGILGDDTMSMSAQNCKVITMARVVTLRGVVDSDAERTAIEALAQRVEGVVRVDNKLEIKTDTTTP